MDPTEGDDRGLGNPSDHPHHHIIIDLTTDDHHPALISSHHHSSSLNPPINLIPNHNISPTNDGPPNSTNSNTYYYPLIDSNDDEIIITGEILPPPQPQTSQPTHSNNPIINHSTSNPSNRSRITHNNQIPNPFNLTDGMATLTANIYAGYYTRHLRTNQSPQPSSSNLTIRDSPPPQTRRSNSRISFGGGGRFSGGRFSGFIAAGLNGIRGLTTNTTRYQQQEETLQEMFSNWGHTDHDDFGLEAPNPLMSAPLHGNLISLSPREIFAAIYDFDHPFQPRESVPPPYKEQDSHPLKIKTGFSKEIIPLDREVLSLDSDSPSNPLPEKQDLRPVCASCDEDLLISQDSCTSGSEGGRRPWILACGHVVDFRCLEQARVRARENQAEIRSKKQPKNVSAKSFTSNPPTRGRPPKTAHFESKAEVTKSSVSKRRKTSSVQSTTLSPPTPTSSDLALRRKERADAREARKSSDCSKPSLSHRCDWTQNSATDTNPVCDRSDQDGQSSKRLASPIEGGSPSSTIHLPATSYQSKGKSKTMDDVIEIELAPKSTTGIEEPAPITTTTTVPSGARASKKRVVKDINDSWIKCPVKGCRGSKGDILASIGSKNAPWEMFV